jgi:hypothetical protein
VKAPSPLLSAVILIALTMAVATVLSEYASQPEPDPGFNKTEVLDVVDRGVRGECEWHDHNSIDCVQSFKWNNQSYKVRDRIDVETVNGTVQINR